MSYYDHAVMITYKLGPWANSVRDGHREVRRPQRRKSLSALARRIGRALQTLRDTRIRLVQVERRPQPETGDSEMHHKGLSAG